MENYLTVQQRVVLYGQTSSWNSIQAGVPQGSVLVPLPFLIYVNDLPNGIGSICKIFVDDTSPFSKVKDETFSETQLNNDLNKISKSAFQWKMLFNPDPKRETENYPSLGFNGTKVKLANSQKHLGLILCKQIVGIMKRLSLVLSRKSLLTIYKYFVRPNLDTLIYFMTNLLMNLSKEKLEVIQYKAALVITSAIKGTSGDRL